MQRNTRQQLVGIIVFTLLLSACTGGGNGAGGNATGSSGGSGGGNVVSNGPFTVAGTITGLSVNGLVLSNGGNMYSPPANVTTFIWPFAVAAGAAYNITPAAQPFGLNCTVTGGSGTMPAANVNTLAVHCAPVAATETLVYSFLNTPDGGGPNGSLIRASDGTLYGTTQYGGTNHTGSVFSVSPAGLVQQLYSFGPGRGQRWSNPNWRPRTGD